MKNEFTKIPITFKQEHFEIIFKNVEIKNVHSVLGRHLYEKLVIKFSMKNITEGNIFHIDNVLKSFVYDEWGNAFTVQSNGLDLDYVFSGTKIKPNEIKDFVLVFDSPSENCKKLRLKFILNYSRDIVTNGNIQEIMRKTFFEVLFVKLTK